MALSYCYHYYAYSVVICTTGEKYLSLSFDLVLSCYLKLRAFFGNKHDFYEVCNLNSSFYFLGVPKVTHPKLNSWFPLDAIPCPCSPLWSIESPSIFPCVWNQPDSSRISSFSQRHRRPPAGPSRSSSRYDVRYLESAHFSAPTPTHSPTLYKSLARPQESPQVVFLLSSLLSTISTWQRILKTIKYICFIV